MEPKPERGPTGRDLCVCNFKTDKNTLGNINEGNNRL